MCVCCASVVGIYSYSIILYLPLFIFPLEIYSVTSHSEPYFFRFWDVNQKFLYLKNNVLVASPRSVNTPEQLMTVLPNNALDPTKLPIFMGLGTGRPTLSCVKSGAGQLQLQLVVNIKDLYQKNEQLLKHKNFTFFSKTGQTQEACSIESIAFPGWFLSTSPEPDKPVAFSHEGGTMITLFYFDKKK
uniref:Interleukin-1 n=1 Tax=Varanus komodoensis TaxID=61221 RepID=A0A8D2LJ51_VARKO